MNTSNLEQFKMALAGTARNTMLLQKINEKYGVTKSLPKELSFTIPPVLVYGIAGGGKTRLVNELIKHIDNLQEGKNFFRLSSESMKTVQDLLDFLGQNISWKGYLCDRKRIDHKHCDCCNIIDPVHPRGPVDNLIIYFDEIHLLNKEIQEALLLIMEDQRYQYRKEGRFIDQWFPRITVFGSTTDPGLLIKPLISRFKIKLKVNRKNDSEMEAVVRSLAAERSFIMDDGCVARLAKIAQGVPREARNHVEGLYNCWSYLLTKEQYTDKLREDIITSNVAKLYCKINNFLEDGTSEDQIKVLRFLNRKTDNGKFITSGLKKIISALGFDEEYYRSFIEPRLEIKGWIDTTRARKITKEGVEYLESVLENNPNIGEVV